MLKVVNLYCFPCVFIILQTTEVNKKLRDSTTGLPSHLLHYSKGDQQQGRWLLFKTPDPSRIWISSAVDCKYLTRRCFPSNSHRGKVRPEQLERQREVFLYFKVYLRKIQGKSEKSVNAQSFKSHVKPVPTLPSILRILSSTYIGHLIPHSYQLIGWPFALESGSRIGLCWKILGYTIWTLAQWSNEGCIVCESGLFFCLTASPGSGMCLAFDQKQHLHTWSVRSHRSSFVLFWRHYLKNTYFLHETQEHFFVSCLQIFD